MLRKKNKTEKRKTEQHHLPHRNFKSPLRYPGGKTRGIKQILQYFPRDIKRICSPFLGGGSLELSLAQKGIEVYAYDNFQPLTNFWQQLLNNPKALAKEVENYYLLSKEQFYKMQKEYDLIKGKRKQAAMFFALNRASFSGTTFCGGMSPNHPRFTKASIERLRNFKVKNFHVQQMDFKKSIAKHKDDFLYLDPPYYTNARLYGNKYNNNKDFDHEGLAKILKQKSNWLLSYNDCKEIRRLYQGYKKINLMWKYAMKKEKISNEIIIMSIPNVEEGL